MIFKHTFSKSHKLKLGRQFYGQVRPVPRDSLRLFVVILNIRPKTILSENILEAI